jgi:hypothetical protein
MSSEMLRQFVAEALVKIEVAVKDYFGVVYAFQTIVLRDPNHDDMIIIVSNDPDLDDVIRLMKEHKDDME